MTVLVDAVVLEALRWVYVLTRIEAMPALATVAAALGIAGALLVTRHRASAGHAARPRIVVRRRACP
jgi:hypothetical protein